MAGTLRFDTDQPNISAAIGGDSWARPFHIEGLQNGPDVSALAVEAYALLPNKGTLVPGPLVGMTVADARITQLWRERTPGGGLANTWSVQGVVIYRSPTTTTAGVEIPDANGPGITQSTEVTLEEYETDLDENDNQITTTFDNEIQAHRVTAYRPVTTIVWGRPEDASPRARADTYTNKRNSGIWNGYADGTVLCQAIKYDTTDGATWNVRYVFVVKPFGWGQRVVHEDPYYPGQPIPLSTIPAGAERDAAQATPNLQQTISFAPLNIALT